MREALEQVYMPEKNRSEVVLRHKMQRIKDFQLKQIFIDVMMHKMMNRNCFEDIDPVPKQIVQQQKQIEELLMNKSINLMKETKKKLGIEKPVGQGQVMSDKMFLIRREQERPYVRLDRKYKQLFNKAFKEYNSFKNSELKNFQKTTKMIVQMLSDIKITKKLLVNMQNEFDDKTQLDKVIRDDAAQDIEQFRAKLEKQLRKIENDIFQNEQQALNC